MGAKHHLHTMRVGKRKAIVVAVVLLHTVLLTAYTFPEQFVPEKLRITGQWYARPLFHQQWRLFAPDPPLCSCELEVRYGQGEWSAIDRRLDTYLQRRMVQNLARHVQAEVHQGDTVPDPLLVKAMRMNIQYSNDAALRGAALPAPEFRLVEQCIIDPQRPLERIERISRLHTP